MTPLPAQPSPLLPTGAMQPADSSTHGRTVIAGKSTTPFIALHICCISVLCGGGKARKLELTLAPLPCLCKWTQLDT